MRALSPEERGMSPEEAAKEKRALEESVQQMRERNAASAPVSEARAPLDRGTEHHARVDIPVIPMREKSDQSAPESSEGNQAAA